MPKIPDRWLSYSPMGKPIPGTRFIPFKVPLKHNLCQTLQDNDRFTPEMLMEKCPKLGLVVDLTYTNRYYDRKIFTSRGIQYEKIYCPGESVPTDKILKQFFSIVDTFLSESHENDSLIGVHCTHGLNRTGYLICRYLNLRMGFQPQEAISAFERARGYSIERKPYVQDIVSGRGIEEQHQKMSGEQHQKMSGGNKPNPYIKQHRRHGGYHMAAPPGMLRDNHVLESPLTNLYQDYYSRNYGQVGGKNLRHEGRTHRWYSPSQHQGSSTYRNLGPLASDKRSGWSGGRFRRHSARQHADKSTSVLRE